MILITKMLPNSGRAGDVGRVPGVLAAEGPGHALPGTATLPQRGRGPELQGGHGRRLLLRLPLVRQQRSVYK